MILLGPGNEVELVTPPAQVLLEPLRNDSPGSSTTVPLPILALAATARQQQHSRGSDAAVALHVPSDEGWLSLHASLPDGTTSERVAIVIQRASREHAAPLRLET